METRTQESSVIGRIGRGMASIAICDGGNVRGYLGLRVHCV